MARVLLQKHPEWTWQKIWLIDTDQSTLADKMAEGEYTQTHTHTKKESEKIEVERMNVNLCRFASYPSALKIGSETF